MEKAENFVYIFNGTPYINLTNRCCCACEFCLRNSGDGIGEDCLWLSREPDADEVLAYLYGLEVPFNEIVFCGYGEPTYRTEELVKIARSCKDRGIRTRLNTNGLGNLINGRDIVPELASVIDTVSVSLNASNAADYNRICKPVFGEKAFDALLDFVRRCVRAGIEIVLSVVNTLPLCEIERCKKIALDLGVKLRVRDFITKAN